MNYTWGILGPGRIESVRRVRTLQLAATTRDFNERAVPGLGGVWFGRQLFLATLGLRVAERATARGSRAGKIAVANAIEALACWLAIKGGLRAGERRVRGTTLLAGKADLSFRSVSRPGFYVSQPMRMGTVNALPALGFVDAAGSRFSAFSCNADGDAFIGAVAEGCRPYGRELVEHLAMWVCGETDQVSTDAMCRALAPVRRLPPRARELLHTRLEQGAAGEAAAERTRRGDALCWVRARRRGAPAVAWDVRPAEITQADHWGDLHAGALFFIARDAALAVLDALELEIATPERRVAIGGALPRPVQAGLATLRDAAAAFLRTGHPAEEAQRFCTECIALSGAEVLGHLLDRDGRILRRLGDQACPGPAFRGGVRETDDESPAPAAAPPPDDPAWPAGISQRIHNLWWLGLDLDGLMDSWLLPTGGETAHV
jgi:hypothetical protein